MIVPKPNGGIRACEVLTRLNKYVRRPVHPLLSTRDAISGISGSSSFITKANAIRGIWQVKLDEASRKLTTFITQWCRFMFLRPPIGCVSTGDEYNIRADAAFTGLDHFTKFVDDYCA